MKVAVSCVVGVAMVIACGRAATAQEWMTTPTPAVPLHPVTLTPSAPPPAPPPVLTAPAPSPEAGPRPDDPIRRFVDPYGLTNRPSSPSTAQPAPLPRFWLVPLWTAELPPGPQRSTRTITNFKRPARST